MRTPLNEKDIMKMSVETKIDKILQICINNYNVPGDFLNVTAIFIATFMFFMIFEPFSKINKFSESVFYWGDMISIYDQNKNKKSKIIWGIIVSLIISILGGLILKYFKIG